MTEYRWNVSDFAEGYDAAAEIVHPRYTVIQDAILERLPLDDNDDNDDQDEPHVIDAGGGSGRLAERILDRWPRASVCIVDQSEPFLALAERRLRRFGERFQPLLARLQDDWQADLATRPMAIVSMSAIHHLDAPEKAHLYQRCADLLAPGGVLINGDEVRDPDDDEYLAKLRNWADHMERIISEKRVPDSMFDVLHGWVERNVRRFSDPRVSGDDCHDTLEQQLTWFKESGLIDVNCAWRETMWAVMMGRKASWDSSAPAP